MQKIGRFSKALLLLPLAACAPQDRGAFVEVATKQEVAALEERIDLLEERTDYQYVLLLERIATLDQEQAAMAANLIKYDADHALTLAQLSEINTGLAEIYSVLLGLKSQRRNKK